MVQFHKLRLSGFKSFVDATELLIQPGMTGIVGPNGCGKSNLVEALRWVMGENSAKRLRGGEMDDVIFGGSGSRPARNVAEVLLMLDNADRRASAQFNESDQLEISRRIDRGEGSTYKVNGREARAKDVQLLFADLSAGAHSTALVSQGRVGAIVNAKPTDRRALLEEAAGITGLHSRRHEAELRLNAAETNLARLDDVIVTLESQLAALKKQARQASRYRSLQDQIRRAEAVLLHLHWLDATERKARAEAALAAAEVEVATLTEAAAAAATRQADCAARLPGLRLAEAEKAAEVQRLTLARGALDKEEERITHERADAERRLGETQADEARAAALAAEAGEMLSRLAAEREELTAIAAREAALAAETASAVARAEREVEAGDGALARETQALATAEAAAVALARRLEEAQDRRRKLEARRDEATPQRQALLAEIAADGEVAALRDALDAAERALGKAETELAEVEEKRGLAMQGETAARDLLAAARARHQRIKAEADALSAVFAASDSDMWPPLIDALSVTPGYELALAAALGDDLQASADLGAPAHWRDLLPSETAATLPSGLRALNEVVSGSPVLARRLAQIALVDSEAECRSHAPTLLQGQRIVAKDGAMWRWDGFTIAAGTETAAAARLKQRNRLKELDAERATAEADLAGAQSAFEAALTASGEAKRVEQDARQALASAYATAKAAREQAVLAERRAAERNSRLAALEQLLGGLQGEIVEATEQGDRTAREIAALPDLEAMRAAVAALRLEAAQCRARWLEAKSAHDRLAREAEQRRQRLSAIDGEGRSWTEREERARRHGAELETRRQGLTAEIGRLAALPAEIARQRGELLDLLGAAEAARQKAADDLAVAESALAEADRAVKGAEARLGEAREARVRAEAMLAQGEEAAATLAAHIREKLDCAPEEALGLAELDPGEELPPREATEQRIARLSRERENIGPVNLRAEAEAEELDRQLTGMQNERGDLIAAIARLRQGIASLNREGRERLLAAFELVNNHFAALFTRLFGGGKAHLQLTEAEDPLDAGLEIFASPPGKKLQVLSLLSGGEQALTALALLFAVFMVNPAPICVLDEVDAPLDDANVERFCSLVEELARETGTRFLVITHHRLTMARMDRLYGVTMAERGVSQLVSVDLQEVAHLKAAE